LSSCTCMRLKLPLLRHSLTQALASAIVTWCKVNDLSSLPSPIPFHHFCNRDAASSERKGESQLADDNCAVDTPLDPSPTTRKYSPSLVRNSWSCSQKELEFPLSHWNNVFISIMLCTALQNQQKFVERDFCASTSGCGFITRVNEGHDRRVPLGMASSWDAVHDEDRDRSQREI